MSVQQQAALCNPFWSKGFADPFVLKVRGRYYAYATESEAHPAEHSRVFPILTSSDMLSWREVGKAMAHLGSPHFFYWAPEVTEHNGQFYMYYAVHTEEFSGGIRVAVADRPEGPFIDSGHDLTKDLVPWAIDPHVFKDEDGQWYLYMTIEYVDAASGLVGSGNAVARLRDPFTLQGPLTRVTRPTQPWQLFEQQRASKGGLDWYTVEGPAVLRQRGRYYQMYSGGCYYRDNYAISYAVSDIPMGPDGLHDTSWQDWSGRQGDPRLVHGDESLIGPGHNSVVLAPNNVDSYIAYHATRQGMKVRQPCLDRLFFHGDELWTPAPIHTPQPAPAMPRLRDLFTTPDLQPAWQPLSGQWAPVPDEECVVQSDENAPRAELSQQERLSSDWLLEINLKYLGGSGGYGVLLRGDDSDSPLQILLTANRQLVCIDTASGASQFWPLPEDILLERWHQLLLSLSGSVLSIRFDGRSAIETILSRSVHSFALTTDACSAAVSAVSLTDHFRDEFLNPDHAPSLLGWSGHLADWQVRDDALRQTSAATGTHVIYKGSRYTQFECAATIKVEQVAGEDGAIGLALQAEEDEPIIIWLQQQAAGATLRVEGIPSASQLQLPKLNLREWHTLRLDVQPDQLHVFLDGPEVTVFPISIGARRIGLATKDASASFIGVWQTNHPS
ncbi:glycoside hydrolase family 43 protein [Dictyobacter aurantiacus]|uniref:Glycoside hydrolase n=1 Tax=Dictyobacter aurantiacus TaxID=1936993 RepID=A0A401ZIF6_9CHLR|nr:glycoside hydrolase family 43 protein [Dictyobacter aurantiacus]GCE06618.1 hypothetical protein KDAU_39470 [Dictyobacter aurantiacus]